MATAKQKLVARALVRREFDPTYRPSDTEIVKKTYHYTQENAEKAAFNVTNSIGVQEAKADIRAAFERKVKDGFLVKKYKRLLDAETPIVHRGVKTGESTPDYGVQADMLKIGFKVKGLLIDAPTIDARSVNQFCIGSEALSGLASTLDKLATLLPALSASSLAPEPDERTLSAAPPPTRS